MNIHEAKTHFSKLLERVELGEEVLIARAGRPIAKVVPFHDPKRTPQLGTAKGQITFKPGWDAPISDEEAAEWGL